MKRPIKYYILGILFALILLTSTGIVGWHDAQTILPAEKRSDFAQSLVIFQFFALLIQIVAELKHPEKRIQNSRGMLVVLFPTGLTIMLAWYLRFWPGPYR